MDYTLLLLEQTFTTAAWIFLVGIQVVLLVAFIFMVSYFCKSLKKKQPEKDHKKTCVILWFISAVAWFLIAQIVWVITSIQMSGS